MDIIFVNNVFYKCLSSILPTIHSTRSQICNYLPRIMLQQRNPHVRTKFINPIHENHTKHPLKLQFKCDYFFFPPLKINRTQKTQLTSCAFCCHGRGTSGGGWGGHRLPCLCVPNGTATQLGDGAAIGVGPERDVGICVHRGDVKSLRLGKNTEIVCSNPPVGAVGRLMGSCGGCGGT